MIDIFLNNQLNFGNLTLCLWKKLTWGLTYFDQFIFRLFNSLRTPFWVNCNFTHGGERAVPSVGISVSDSHVEAD